MKKALCLVVMLAMVASASATVRVFITSSAGGLGLENPANAFVPTISTVYSNGLNENAYDYSDYYGAPGPIRPGDFPAVDAPSGTADTPVQVNVGEGQFAYVWLQFQDEVKGSKINGLLVRVSEVGSSDPASNLTYNWYLCNNMGLPQPTKRWDGNATPPAYPEWHNNPQTLVAITAYGLQNTALDAPWNLWDGTGRYALLGAINGEADMKKYEISIINISYASGTPNGLAGGVFQFVPEPASLLLMGLAGLLLRRR